MAKNSHNGRIQDDIGRTDVGCCCLLGSVRYRCPMKRTDNRTDGDNWMGITKFDIIMLLLIILCCSEVLHLIVSSIIIRAKVECLSTFFMKSSHIHSLYLFF